ncbi:MAG: hypothetical protein KDD33_09345 [Bdellovibrionales bacterium]|nr:hypothetical protein [Bdellovibrionales bacterium]
MLGFKNLFTALGLVSLIAACSSDNSFYLQGEEETFLQSVTQSNVKIDILWVVDNSGSMASSQDNVAANFQSFIEKFQSTQFDFQIAVTTTDAWRAPVDGNPALARFRDGTDATSHTGVTVIKPDTPDIEQTFITNIRQGITGHADERGLQSLKEALSNSDNLAEPFPRTDAILAVIVLTDEDDFSHDGTANVQNIPDPYNNPDLHDPMIYYDFLSTLTNSTTEKRNFIFNVIGILDEDCKAEIEAGWGGRKLAERYFPVVDASGGYKGSICDDFSDVMAGISDKILEYTTRFPLSREPVVSSIVVKVDGNTIPNDATNGWSYDANTMSISFHGNAIPGKDAKVAVSFDPAGLK